MKSKLLYTGVALAGMAMANEPAKPNILVLLTDDQRPDTLGCYNVDCPIETPALDRLANDGIRFQNSFVTTPICNVSRASVLTGRYVCNHEVYSFGVPLSDEDFSNSYPAVLKEAGYFVGSLGKYGIGVTPIVTNTFDMFIGQAGQGPKFREYNGKMLHDAEWLTVQTENFLDRVPDGQPFCLQLNYKEPHPSSCPAPEDDHLLDNWQLPRRATDSREEFLKLPEYVQNGLGRFAYLNEMHNEEGDPNPFVRDYFEKIASVDRSVGKVMDMLKERGLADNTVIIFLADHGTHLGEKQLFGKWTPYEESLRIPFIVYDPRPQARKGVVCESTVLNIDVAPTVLALAGAPVPDVMDGRNIFDLVSGERDMFCYEHYTSPSMAPRYIPRSEGIHMPGFKYVRWVDMDPPIEEFYNLSADPDERNNLIREPEYSDQIAAARKQFAQWRAKNPVSYQYDTYGAHAEFGAKEIDWKRFEKAHPTEYSRIKAEVDRFGVTWEQAVNDWAVRYEICTRDGNYWY